MSIKFWKNKEDETIEPTLFSDQAEEFAKKIAGDNQRSKNQNQQSQLRKFYDEVVRLDMMAKGLNIKQDIDKKKWDNVLPQVHMLTAKAAYAQGRKLISDNFLNFIKSSIDQIKKPKDLNVFASSHHVLSD